MGERRSGDLEMTIAFTPAGGGETVEAQSTPSMWALADEWIDSVMAQNIAAGRDHTRAWYNGKLISCIELQAAQEAGLVAQGGFSLVRIAEMLNAYDVEIVDEDGGAEATPDPTPGPGAA